MVHFVELIMLKLVAEYHSVKGSISKDTQTGTIRRGLMASNLEPKQVKTLSSQFIWVSLLKLGAIEG